MVLPAPLRDTLVIAVAQRFIRRVLDYASLGTDRSPKQTRRDGCPPLQQTDSGRGCSSPAWSRAIRGRLAPLAAPTPASQMRGTSSLRVVPEGNDVGTRKLVKGLARQRRVRAPDAPPTAAARGRRQGFGAGGFVMPASMTRIHSRARGVPARARPRSASRRAPRLPRGVRIARKCLRGALPARGSKCARPDACDGAHRPRARAAARVPSGGVGLK